MIDWLAMSTDTPAERVPAPREPTLEELVGRPPVPRLRIHHLLVATAVVAALLAAAMISRDSESFGLAQFVESGMGVVVAISTGLAVTVVAFGIYWHRAGFRFFHQPGHWLLLEQALLVGLFVMAGVGGLLQLAPGDALNEVLMGVNIVYGFLLQLVSFCLSLWAARKIADSRWWRAVFLIDAGTWAAVWFSQLVGLAMFSLVVLQLAPMASVVAVAVAAWQDRRLRRPRDWAHWLGATLRLAGYGAFLIPIIWDWLAEAAGWGTGPM